MQLLRPQLEHLAEYARVLQRGWSGDNLRGAAAAHEELAQIEADPAAFVALMHDPEGRGPAVTLPDGSKVPRIPGLRRWLWEDDAEPPDGGRFAGSINLRWAAGDAALPPHVLGHIGYAVVPWKQRRGLATEALALMLPLAREVGLNFVEITTDPDNVASQRVITANGGVLIEAFIKGPAYGHVPGLRYRIDLTAA